METTEQKFKTINAGAVSHLPFSSAIVAGGFVYVSGQASVDSKTGEIISDTFENEMLRSIDNLKAVLKEAGATLADVINVRGYVTNPEDLKTYNKMYAEIFAGHHPTRTTITKVFDSIKFEIDCVAYIGE